MRIALISDIHGNDLALSAVLADIRARGVDQIACLGDTATLGPRPVEVLERIQALGGPCIMGNHDEFLIQPDQVERYTRAPVIVDAIAWCRAQLAPRHLRFVKSFTASASIPLEGDRTLLLFHGSPESHMHDVLATTPPEQIDAWLGTQSADVMAGGHTHIQMLRQHGGRWIVNPGSVGMPFRCFVHGRRPEIMPYAEYALVQSHHSHIDVQLHRVMLDKRALRQAAADWHGGPRLLRDDLLLQYA